MLGTLVGLQTCSSAPGNLNTAQSRFDQACKFANGAVGVARPLLPVLDPEIGVDARLAIRSLFVTIETACTAPLDVENSADVTQRIYDAAGQVIALVVHAQKE